MISLTMILMIAALGILVGGVIFGKLGTVEAILFTIVLILIYLGVM